ncbi:MAG TPA: YqaE/Pmp3 family membrane protein [Cytophagaceae bacterium]|jgi:uncharacterized membrane protein YqaE (UPF0057 family)
MKKTNTINVAFALCLSVLAFSCGPKKQIGFFSNTEKTYQVKQSPIADPNNSDLGAMAEGAAVVESSSLEAMSDAQVEKNISSTPAYKAEKIEKKEAIAPAVVAPVKEAPRKITKEQKKEIKKALEVGATDTNTLLLVIIAILLPPLAVALVDGIGGPFLLSIILTILFWLPGIIYALYRVLRKS